MRKVNILGADIDDVTMEEAVEEIGRWIREKTPAQVNTLNAEILFGAYSDPKLLSTINRCAMVTPDGSGILWAARRLGRPLRERVTGIDLLQRILKEAPQKKWSLYFYGSRPEVLEQAVANMKRDYPGLSISGYTHGYIPQEAQNDLLRDIREKSPDLLFVALGAPRQEYWISEHLPELPPLVAIGVGGSLDVISGTLKRAPSLFQKLHLEWLYRTLIQPSRIGRTLVLPRFMALVSRTAREEKKKK